MDDETLTNQPDASHGVASVKTPTRVFGAVSSDESETLVDGGGRAAPAASPPKEHDLSGTTLGGYQLVRKIAEGGMGEVYEAIQTNLARKVALKILTERLAARPEFLQRFEREAKAAAALNHPNVVQVYDFGEAGGRHYLIMEYVDGEDLADYVQRNGRLTIAEALAVIEQAARALKAAHEKSIIHRDIKPANLMLTTAGIVKVSDLGLAKILTDDSEVTATGVGIGSPHFLAPEQADDARSVDHRADMYALGITLLYLLTGRKPYEGTSAFSVVLAHAQKPLPSGMELGTELPEEIEGFVQRLAAKKPADRYADYDELLVDLDRVKSGYAPVSRIGQRTATGWWRSQPVLVGVAGALLIATLAVMLWPYSKRVSTPDSASLDPKSAASQPAQVQAPPVSATPPQTAFQPPAEMRPAFPGGGGQAFDRQRFPLPVKSFPDFNALKDGPVETMLAEADAYAKANPRKPTKIIDRYRQLQQKAVGTARQAEIEQRMNTWVLTHELAVLEAMEQYQQKMDKLLRERKVQEAYQAWWDFPVDLRTREVDQKIQQVLERYLPPNFQPTTPARPAAKDE